MRRVKRPVTMAQQHRQVTGAAVGERQVEVSVPIQVGGGDRCYPIASCILRSEREHAVTGPNQQLNDVLVTGQSQIPIAIAIPISGHDLVDRIENRNRLNLGKRPVTTASIEDNSTG